MDLGFEYVVWTWVLSMLCGTWVLSMLCGLGRGGGFECVVTCVD